MSWTDKELGEMAKKAEARQAFSYQDSFWSEMEALLPAKKKSIWPYFLAIAIPAIGAISMLFVWPSQGITTSHVAKTIPFQTDNINFIPVNDSKIVQTSQNNTSNKVVKNGNFQTERSSKIAMENAPKQPIFKDVKNPKDDLRQSFLNSADQEVFISTNTIESTLITNAELEQKDITQMRRLSFQQAENKTEELATVDRLPFSDLTLLEFNQNRTISALPYYKKRRYYSAFGELGFGLGEAYTANQIGHTEFVSFSAGVRLTKNKVFAQAGIGLEAEWAGLEIREREKCYNYGSKTFENRMSYQQVYHLNLPINFGYHFAKHTVQIGATPSYLLGTKMRYAYLENESVRRNETIYGEKTGWNSFGLKMNIGYGFDLFPSMTLGANFQVQLMEQLDKVYSTDENKMPISGQVFIRKTLR